MSSFRFPSVHAGEILMSRIGDALRMSDVDRRNQPSAKRALCFHYMHRINAGKANTGARHAVWGRINADSQALPSVSAPLQWIRALSILRAHSCPGQTLRFPATFAESGII